MRGRLARILPPGRNRRLYLGITLIDATGSGAFGPITILYLTQVVGLAPVRVGVGLTVAGLFGMAAIPVAGALADRFDARALTAGGFALSAVGFAAYTGVHSFAAFLVVGSFIEIVEGTAKSARRMFAFSLAEGEDRIGLLAYERSTRNVGYGLGGLLASAALAGGSRDAYVAVLLLNAASYAAGTLMVLRLPRALPTAPARDHGGYRTVLRDRMYVALASLSSVLWLNDSVLKVGLALWVVERTHVPPYSVGLLFTLNTALVVLLQVRVSRGAGTLAGAGRAYACAGAALLACCGLFAAAAGRSTPVAAVLLTAAVAALTLGELTASAAEWGASLTLAREELRGRYLAVFSTGASLQQAIGPAIVTAALVHGGRGGWIVLGAVLLAVGLGARTLARAAAGRVTP